MARKRLSAPAIEKLEEIIGDGVIDAPESAVFGVVNTDKQIVRKLKMTQSGVDDVSDSDISVDHLIPEKLEKLLYPKRNKVVFGGRGCLAIGTMVRMFDGGLKRVEDIVVGDKVMGPDSKPRNVLSICRGFDDMYTVHQKYADDYTVNSSHILSLRKIPSAISDETKTPDGKRIYRYYPNEPEILNIGVSEYLSRATSKKFRHVFKGWRTGWDFNDQSVPVDPYFLGLWLGDGSSRSVEVCTPDPEIVDYLHNVASQYGMQVKVRDDDRCPVYAITNGRAAGMGKNTNPLLTKMQQLGVINNKHIPDCYIKNSREVRLQILAGLLDTDSHYHKEKKSYCFTSINKDIAFSLMDVARSLGFKSSIIKKTDVTFEYKGEKRIYEKDVWEVFVSGDLHTIPCRVKRKIAEKTKSTRGKMTEVSLSYAGHGEYAGFTLDGDHLFLLADGTVTHNSGKTRTVTTILTERARFKPDRIACFREIQQSIEDSSYQELKDEIDRKGETKEFRVINNEITHKVTKAKFRFKGLYRNQTTVKGFAGITVAWVEEAENVSQTSWEILTPTVRADGSEIWVTFNPNKEHDPTWKTWVEPFYSKLRSNGGIYEDEENLIIECNYSDNPWFWDTPLPSQMQRMKETDFDRYQWVWGGRFNKRNDEQVFGGKWRIDNFEVKPEWHGPYFGMDFGFSTDPTAMVEVYIEELPVGRRNIYINREYGKVGLEITDTPAAMEQSFPMAKRARWYADCARPETISHIKHSGFDIHPCTKWPGSVEDGVTWLRGCDSIIIHERCKEMQNEAAMYSYKVDKLTGNVLTDIVDAFNHYWDAVRYSLNDHIVQRGSGMLIRRRR